MWQWAVLARFEITFCLHFQDRKEEGDIKGGESYYDGNTTHWHTVEKLKSGSTQ
jgi:hypothetical protein